MSDILIRGATEGGGHTNFGLSYRVNFFAVDKVPCTLLGCSQNYDQWSIGRGEAKEAEGGRQ